ncbi:MAG: NAD-dependent epimerase/dehydratase family protein [Flavobacteriales bacterium]|nr:NAD-dependent epimerase/dehydratase family protein [Flavobacteriales bacterium]MBT3963871.1 NAD-dependent epimerase/dehydratase family protein [Flavobacteriales bacterium]MBT4706221.1 NAD-dependent epimerase/dehydratase family protein [Flavobacteriales bacterium]MBT4931406.1 NAD-dependent epimerase/dehydratase family protein [Flavobacteriales bacterium]MBT5133160.1 NAD-dependent epimerase/dehydratase family protein [Flavobacteriales bacterium]
MKVIITGATGMVGKGVLLECLDHPDVTEVLVIGRRSTNETHPKLKELVHQDFTDFSTVSDQLHGYDACFASMGVSAAGMSSSIFCSTSSESQLLSIPSVAITSSMIFC